jgi:hypothetical protein
MAEQRQQRERKELKQDPLVEKLKADPSEDPNVKMFTGYLGRSTQVGYWRLYLTPQLNEYLEINEEDISHNQSLATEQSPLGGTMLWIRRGANVQYTRTVSRQVQAEFLQGDMTATFLSGVGLGRFGRLTDKDDDGGFSDSFWCKVAVSVVVSVLSVVATCGPATVVVVTAARVEGTSQINCPSAVEACPTRVLECFIPNTLLGPGCQIQVTTRPELCQGVPQ